MPVSESNAADAQRSLSLHLPYRAPFDTAAMMRFLTVQAVPGIETVDGDTYRRSLRLPSGYGEVALRFQPGHVAVTLRLAEGRDRAAALGQVRALLDLDADPVAVDDALRRLPAVRPLVRDRPGIRSPGTVDGFEVAVRAVVGQQVSVAGARTVLGRIVAAHGESPADGIRLFPAPQTLAAVRPEQLPMPRARGRALIGLAAAVADGELVLAVGTDLDQTERRLRDVSGIGAWTAGYVRMRLADPDVLLDTDLALRRVLAELHIDADDARRCRPWRSYLSHQLWAHFQSGRGAGTPPR